MAQERQIGARLEHPNIARLYDAGVDAKGRSFIAMEFIAGTNIDQHCDEHHLDTAARLGLVVQVLHALAYAHGRLVIHCDLKPANVLVSAEGMAHLLDFGIATLLGASSSSNASSPRGFTPRYAAPEQRAGATPGVQADIYSLGMLLDELLGGRDLHREVLAIVARATRPDATERYASADAFAQDIERHLSGDPVLAYAGGPFYRAARALRRHWVGASAVLAVVLALLAGGTMALLQMRQAMNAAERERVVKSFLAEVFSSQARRGPAQALVEDSAQLIQHRFADQPVLQAELYGLVSGGYAEMGAFSLASELLGRQLDTLERIHAPASQRLQAHLALAEALIEERRADEAEPQLAAARALLSAGDEASLCVAVLAARIELELGRLDAAARVLDEADVQLARSDAHPHERAWVLAIRAALLVRRDQPLAALPLYEQAVAVATRAEGDQSLTAALIRISAAHAFAYEGELAIAARLFEPAIAALRARGGRLAIRAAFETGVYWDRLYNSMQRVPFAQASAGVSEALAQLRAQGDAVPTQMRLYLENSLGSMRMNWGDIANGAPQTLKDREALLRAARTPMDKIDILGGTGLAYMHTGEHAKADADFRARLQQRINAGRGASYLVGVDVRLLAVNASMWGHHAEALRALDETPSLQAVRSGGVNPRWYGELLRATRARVLLDRAEAGDAQGALQLLDREPFLDRPAQYGLMEGLDTSPPALRAEALCALGRSREGLAAWQAFLPRVDRDHNDNAPQLARIRAVMSRCAMAAGQPRLARTLAAQAQAAFSAQPGVSPYYKAPLLAVPSTQRLAPS